MTMKKVNFLHQKQERRQIFKDNLIQVKSVSTIVATHTMHDRLLLHQKRQQEKNDWV